MNVTADIELDIDDIMREIAEEVVEANYCEFITLYDYNEYITDSMTEYLEESQYATMDDVRTVVNDLTYDTEGMVKKIASLESEINFRHQNHYMTLIRQFRELENQVAIARRAVNLLLEERENRWYRKLRRLCDSMIRRVHWHMPRR